MSAEGQLPEINNRNQLKIALDGVDLSLYLTEDQLPLERKKRRTHTITKIKILA